MVKCGVFFAVRTEFLNVIYTSFGFIVSTCINQKIKISLSLSFGFTIYHPNVFTLIVSVSEGRAGIAWEPSNKMMLSLPLEITSLTSP
jgi:hypothetical protein